MTSPYQPAPKGGRSYEEVAGLRTVKLPQAVAKRAGQAANGVPVNQDTYDLAAAMQGNFFTSILSGFVSLGAGLAQVLTDLADALSGTYGGDDPKLQQIRDGQLDLLSRIDLLGGSGYCCAYMTKDLRIGPGRNRALPFDGYSGPHQDAEIVTLTRTHPGVKGGPLDEQAIRLGRKGLWQINARFFHQVSHLVSGYDVAWAEIAVLRPDGSLFSTSRLPQWSNTQGPRGMDAIAGVKMVVVPEPGYYVQARFYYSVLVSMRRVYGGTAWSELSVTQWSDDIDDAGSPGAVGEITAGGERSGGDVPPDQVVAQ